MAGLRLTLTPRNADGTPVAELGVWLGQLGFKQVEDAVPWLRQFHRGTELAEPLEEQLVAVLTAAAAATAQPPPAGSPAR